MLIYCQWTRWVCSGRSLQRSSTRRCSYVLFWCYLSFHRLGSIVKFSGNFTTLNISHIVLVLLFNRRILLFGTGTIWLHCCQILNFIVPCAWSQATCFPQWSHGFQYLPAWCPVLYATKRHPTRCLRSSKLVQTGPCILTSLNIHLLCLLPDAQYGHVCHLLT